MHCYLYVDIPPTLIMYFGQVIYEIERPGLEWWIRIIFGKGLNTIQMVFSNYLQVVTIFLFIVHSKYISQC